MREVQAERRARRQPFARADLREAIMLDAVERVRPKMMTVVAIMAGLLPSSGAPGPARRSWSAFAVPMIGGMVSSTLLTLVGPSRPFMP